jgi:hypothetical protein
MLVADVLTFRELMMREPLLLATLQNAVLEFLRGRDDVVVFGAQAVNAYVDEPRMTQGLDLLSKRQAPPQKCSPFGASYNSRPRDTAIRGGG